MPKFQFNIDHATKLISVILSMLITIAAINNILNKPSEIEPWILSIHYILLSIALVLAELKVEYVVRNFGLLNFIIGKGLFMFFLGALLFDSGFSFQLLVSILCIICGFVYMVGAINTLEVKQPANSQVKT